jgi:alcohol dehydrogenase class IV
VLLPEVMRFNLESNPLKYNAIANAIGSHTALEGIEKIAAMAKVCGIPQHLSDLGIDRSEIAHLADLAMRVTRLLVNNPREVTRQDAIDIYTKLF